MIPLKMSGNVEYAAAIDKADSMIIIAGNNSQLIVT